MMLFDAVYINRGGGKKLLEYIINHCLETGFAKDIFFLLDSRFNSETIEKLDSSQYVFIRPSEWNRIVFYKTKITLFDSVFCFANVPPPISIDKKKVTIYFQNVLLLHARRFGVNKINIFLYFLKKMYIKSRVRSNYSWIVQTETTRQLLGVHLLGGNSKIYIYPIFESKIFDRSESKLEANDFNYLYVADGSPHKNHQLLIDAWFLFVQRLNQKEITLNLTLDASSFDRLNNQIGRIRDLGYKVINHGFCSSEKIRVLYSSSKYLVFPSLAESFGLPLVEAAASGCYVIASDLPYVYDVIEPSVAFNPYDVESLVSALLISKDSKSLNITTLKVKSNIDELLKYLCNDRK